MYLTHWGLRKAPFHAGDPEFFYLSATHEEALARLHFLVENRRRVGLLLGECGAGKTVVLRRFARELRREGISTTFVQGSLDDPRALLWSIVTGFGLNVPRREPADSLWGRIVDRLAERRYQWMPSVILVDDMDRAPRESRNALTQLLRIESGDKSLVTVVFAAQPHGVASLGETLLAEVDLRIDLDVWSAAETAEYIQQCLAKAGRQTPLFEDSALLRLHELSGGQPRHVGRLADLALVAGANDECSTIDSRTIENVHRELTVATASPPLAERRRPASLQPQ